MRVQNELLEIACRTTSVAELRGAALALTTDALGAEVGMFVTDLRGGGLGKSLVGFDAPASARIERRWERYGRDICPVQDVALREGVATDVRTLGRELERTRVYRELMGPLGGTESLFVVPSFAGRPIGFLMLGRMRGRFSEGELALARALGPSLAVSCVAMSAVEHEAPASRELSPAERDLFGYLELGYTTREIALARGTSFCTVRNQLSSLYRKLGVTNRTEAVGLRRRAAHA